MSVEEIVALSEHSNEVAIDYAYDHFIPHSLLTGLVYPVRLSTGVGSVAEFYGYFEVKGLI